MLIWLAAANARPGTDYAILGDDVVIADEKVAQESKKKSGWMTVKSLSRKRSRWSPQPELWSLLSVSSLMTDGTIYRPFRERC